MNVEIEFEKLKQTILSAAKFHGLSSEYLDKNWSINYRRNLDEKFNRIVSDFNGNIKLMNRAIEHSDILSATAALVRAKISTHMLMIFFENINDDFMQLGWGDELKDKWSKNIPDDYQIPKKYSCIDTNRPYHQQVYPNEK